MEIKIKDVIAVINKIDNKVDSLMSTIEDQRQIIQELESKNQNLSNLHQKTQKHIKEYVKELEKIKQSLCQ